MLFFLQHIQLVCPILVVLGLLGAVCGSSAIVFDPTTIHCTDMG